MEVTVVYWSWTVGYGQPMWYVVPSKQETSITTSVVWWSLLPNHMQHVSTSKNHHQGIISHKKRVQDQVVRYKWLVCQLYGALGGKFGLKWGIAVGVLNTLLMAVDILSIFSNGPIVVAWRSEALGSAARMLGLRMRMPPRGEGRRGVDVCPLWEFCAVR